MGAYIGGPGNNWRSVTDVPNGLRRSWILELPSIYTLLLRGFASNPPYFDFNVQLHCEVVNTGLPKVNLMEDY